MKFITLFTFISLISIFTFAQQTTFSGTIKDSVLHEALTGVAVYSNLKQGTRSDINGKFTFTSKQNIEYLVFSYTGYQEKKVEVKNFTTEQLTHLQIELVPKTKQLNIVTISGSKFEKRVAEEIVSIEVVKPAQILNAGNNSIDDALQRVPGVDVIDNQINIRGGSGWSYGAGSRVMVLVDDMPMLTADAGDAKLDFLPIENCEQMEVLKGASSSLYGSSALNGVVNFRTGFARNKPKTKMMIYNGMYGNPKEKSWKWWNKQQPMFQGGYFMHAQKFGQLDMVLGSAWFSEDSYLQGDLQRRGRGNVNLRYRFKNNPRLNIGVNANVQLNKSQTFFFWQPDTVNGTHCYQPFGGLNDSTTTVNKNQGQRINIDPYLNFLAKNGGKHILRTRWFRSKNSIPEKQQSSLADTYFTEYQYSNEFNSTSSLIDKLRLVTGVMSSYNNIVGELYGNHTSYNVAPYIQLEKKLGKLWTNIGARYELNHLDQNKTETKPVFRAGLNYEINKATFLRASFGQGYRYPSIAEKFVSTNFGASRVFPNSELQSETGWSSELALKQFYKIGSWMGYIDVAGFWTQYNNMMEFNFNFYLPKDSTISNVAQPTDYLGFKSINVGNTKINGIDISIVSQGKINKMDSRFLLAYTLMNPVLLNPDSVIMANISGETKTLKYRYRNTLKFDMEHQYQKFIVGATVLYNSAMQNIDEVFENTKPTQNVPGIIFELGTQLPSSVHAFREKYNHGNAICDVRFSYLFSNQFKASFIVKNIFNTVVSERPAIVSPPRNFTLQLAMDL